MPKAAWGRTELHNLFSGLRRGALIDYAVGCTVLQSAGRACKRRVSTGEARSIGRNQGGGVVEECDRLGGYVGANISREGAGGRSTADESSFDVRKYPLPTLDARCSNDRLAVKGLQRKTIRRWRDAWRTGGPFSP
jgi:hypothetical protein